MKHLIDLEMTITMGDALLAIAAAATIGLVVGMLITFGQLAAVVEGNRIIAAWWKDSRKFMIKLGFSERNERAPTSSLLVVSVLTAAENLSWLRWPRSVVAGYTGHHRLVRGAA